MHGQACQMIAAKGGTWLAFTLVSDLPPRCTDGLRLEPGKPHKGLNDRI